MIMKNAKVAYAIVRVDLFQDSDVSPENMVTVKEIVWSEKSAQMEVDRLKAINSESRYFWQCTRVVQE